ncbi:MAG TPA: (Fe-S)-binding protein [Opitutaceae bacterium]|nr:(Fe-S)-binding protein [Opitutaceae bacterium]
MMSIERKPPLGKKVQLLATCLCDAFYDDAAIATVQVLEHLGITVEFPEAQTCCGQPAFNAGDWTASRRVVRHMVHAFRGELPVIVPSSSCAAMVFHGSLLAFEHEPDRPEVEQLARRTWELADFLVHGLGVKTWPGRFDGALAFHRSCHSRGTASGEAAAALMRSIAGVTLVEFGEGEQCCGFGGTFSVTFPNISEAMGRLKLEHLRAAQPRYLVGIDTSCLMHLGGLAEKEGRPLEYRHVAQVLRDALRNGGLLKP